MFEDEQKYTKPTVLSLEDLYELILYKPTCGLWKKKVEDLFYKMTTEVPEKILKDVKCRFKGIKL